MDVIPLDASLVKGSHGACPADEKDYPVLILPEAAAGKEAVIESTEVYAQLKRMCLGGTQ
jgi:hypothetical protein